MPHQCTNCGQSFADGSKEMLSGCPQCGGNKFQYLPSGAIDGDLPTEDPPERPGDDYGVADAVGRAATTVRDYVSQRGTDDEPPERAGSTAPQTQSGSAGRGTERETAESPETSGPSSPADEPEPTAPPEASERTTHAGVDRIDTGPDGDDRRTAETTDEGDSEDSAQASARGEMVEADDLPGGTISAGSSPPSEGRVVKEPDSPDRPNLDELRKELNDQFESIKIIEPGQYELNLMELYDREEHIIALQEDGRYIIEVPDTWREDE